MIKIAIFASGSGTNAENIANYFSGKQSFEISLVLSNKPDAYVLERARRLHIETATFTKTQFNDTNDVINLLINKEIDFIVLAGFLLRVPQNIIARFSNRIINIHPALLPKFGGKGMYGDFVHESVVAAGEHESGITIHYINENYDEGNIIFQASCPVNPADSPLDVAQKVHALEYKHFPEVIEKVLLQQFTAK